jgi:hypothetical protein
MNNQILFLCIRVTDHINKIYYSINFGNLGSNFPQNEFVLTIKNQEYILPIDSLTLPITKDNIKEIIFKVEKWKCFQ